VLVKESLVVNHWLAGFIQADGSFKSNAKTRQNTISNSCGHSNRSKNRYALKLIQNEFGGSVSYRKFQDTYYYSSGSFINAKKFIDYLESHKVLGLNWDMYCLWRSAYVLVENKTFDIVWFRSIGTFKSQLIVKSYVIA
jgi:hypothetical protein